MVNLLLAIIYLSFISLGLPDSVLGAAWPSVYGELSVPLSFAGLLSMIITMGSIISSLLSDRLTRRFGSGKVTAVSVAMTAGAIMGFSASGSFWQLCLFAIPYGLGAGGVDAALNNYVALHYASRHMSWLHCMWGLGASLGPYIMGLALTGGGSWRLGYRYIGYIQITLALLLFLTLPIWKNRAAGEKADGQEKAPDMKSLLRLRGVKEVLVCFFCYCALEQTSGLWAGSYLVLKNGMAAEKAASLAGLFFLGITIGRGACGFLTYRFSDRTMVRMGFALLMAGVALLPLGGAFSLWGLALLGLGCAPVYPCIIHSTPSIFGAENSQTVIGLQMAFAYVGILVMPPLFGIVARSIGAGLLPAYLAVLLLLMALMYEKLCRGGGKMKKKRE